MSPKRGKYSLKHRTRKSVEQKKPGADLLQGEKNLRQTNAFLRSILESSSAISIMSTDLNSNLLYWNKGAENMFGYRAEEIVNRRKISILYNSEKKTKKVIERARDFIMTHKKGTGCVVSEVTKTGRRLWLSLTLTPRFDEKRRIIGILGIGEDITERKEAEEKLRVSLEKRHQALIGIIHAMAATVEVRDPYTAGHQRRVASLARAIAEEMGLPQKRLEGIYMAGVIHDIGKIYIPAEILTRPGQLTDKEFNLIKDHAQVGYNLLKDIEFPWPIAQVALQHHERINGSGYPQGFKKNKIILEARIIAVADVVETMSTHRPYRAALGLDKALAEIKKNRGVLYDSRVVDACIKVFKKKEFRFEEGKVI